MTDAPQLVNDMDQSNLEEAVVAALEKRIGWQTETYESTNYGVVAVPRLEGGDFRKVDWQEIAAELARETGIGVTCVANCDWTFSDKCDEEATFVAFACPGVPEGYRDDEYRNLIRRVDPDTAPLQKDFDDAKRARRIVEAHLLELQGRREMLIAAGRSDHAATDEFVAAEELKALTAFDREAVSAVLDLDFARAAEAVAKAAPAPTPGM